MFSDCDGIVELGRAECLARLGESGIGRVAVTDGALPSIVPVTYAVHHGDILFRASTSPRMAAAVHGTVVALEVDNLDRLSDTGWSVVVVGHSRAITEDADIAFAQQLPPTRWTRDGGVESILRLSADVISGQRFGEVISLDAAAGKNVLSRT